MQRLQQGLRHSTTGCITARLGSLRIGTYRVLGRACATWTGLAHTDATVGRVARAAPAKDDETKAIFEGLGVRVEG